MSKFDYEKLAYQRRYAKVYEAGAHFWEEPAPTDELVMYVRQMHFPRGTNVIESGCGEGRDSIFLAKQGFEVAAVDVALSAVKRAKQRAAEENVSIDFIVADATDLGRFPSLTYDLAVSVGYLHMVINEKDRQKHLNETLRLLKLGGFYFSCNIDGQKRVRQGDICREALKPGDLTPRKIVVGGEEKEILLPIIAAWPKSGQQYKEEFETAGFKIMKMFHRVTRPLGSCWIIAAQKPAK